MLKKTFLRVLFVYLIFALAIISFPARGWAMFIPAGQTDVQRQADVNTIQKTLESAEIKQRLLDYGLSPEEAMTRINNLSDEQLHQYASQLNSLQAGGHHGHLIIILLLVILIIIIV